MIKNDFENFIQLLNEDLDIRVGSIMYEKIFIENGNGTDLYIKYFPEKTITISRISFTEQRKGLGTTLLKRCKEICKEKNFNKIVIECALTPEIISFCNKHNFIPIKSRSFECDNKIVGDYELVING